MNFFMTFFLMAVVSTNLFASQQYLANCKGVGNDTQATITSDGVLALIQDGTTKNYRVNLYHDIADGYPVIVGLQLGLEVTISDEDSSSAFINGKAVDCIH
ncbi:MAG: hypothetical protein HOE90_01030 [Bacteriovoracaceae bacterium]|nr:hypothetical protein [Bacteriovoracaceae bacterium]